MKKCAWLFLVALAVALWLSAVARPGPGNGHPAFQAGTAGETETREMTITVRDIPDRYVLGGISLWNEHGEGFGSHAGVVAGNSLSVTLPGVPGLYDAILSLWRGDTGGHWRIWSLGLGPGANTVPFGDFIEFTD